MRPYEVLYDGGCGLCAGTVVWLRRLDLLHRLRFVDFDRDWARLSQAHPSLSHAACAEAMHVIAPGGRRTAGFDGFRSIARVLPPLWPLLPLLYLPAVPSMGRLVYRYVARHRTTTCVLPPVPRSPNPES